MEDKTVRGTLTVAEAADRLGIHRLSAYKAIREGTFPCPVVQVGKRLLIPKAALDRLLSGEAP